MVDPISGSGNAAGIGQVGRSQNSKQTDKTSEAGSSAGAASDQVELSSEALEAQANDTARELRLLLEQDGEAALAGDVKRLNALL